MSPSVFVAQPLQAEKNPNNPNPKYPIERRKRKHYTMSKTDSVMLTGATGLLGQEMVRVLTSKYPELKVKVLIHEETEEKADLVFANLKVEKVRSRPGLEEDAASFQGVYSLFLIPPPVESRVEIVRHILLAAKKAGVKFVMTPAHLSVREKDTVLARSFKEIENEIKRTDIPHCFLHSELFMDFILSHGDQIKAVNPIFSCCIDPDARYNPVAARDLAEVASNILLRPGDHEDTRYTITGPTPLSMTDMAGVLSKTLGREVKYVREKPEICIAQKIRKGRNSWLAKAMVEAEQNITSETEEYTSGDLNKLLDREPISFERFIQEHKEAFVV